MIERPNYDGYLDGLSAAGRRLMDDAAAGFGGELPQ
jgi:hypothetical protein